MPSIRFLTRPVNKMAASSLPPEQGCTPQLEDVLRRALSSLHKTGTWEVELGTLRHAMHAAANNLADPCGDARLIAHLSGMAVLLGYYSAPLPAPIVAMLPERAPFERAMAQAAERAFQKAHAETQTIRASPDAILKLRAQLELYRHLAASAQSLKDNAVIFAACTRAASVSRHATRAAQSLATELNGAQNVEPSAQETLLANLPELAANPALGVVTHVVKDRKMDPFGVVRTQRKTMTTSFGTSYALEAPLTDRTGTHGRVHQATAYRGPHRDVLVKVQRTQQKLIGKQDVIDAPLAHLLKKAATAKLALGRVNAGLEARASLFEGDAAPLRRLDARTASVAVHDQFVDISGKFYQVMSAMAGDLADVSRTLSAAVNDDPDLEIHAAQVRLSVAAQAFLQLEALHHKTSASDGGMAHLDIKPGNIVFGHDGIVRLIDFDESRHVLWGGSVQDGTYQTGSLASPERDSALLQQRGGALSKPYDVWCLGVSLLALGAPTPSDGPDTEPQALSPLLAGPRGGAFNTFTKADWFAVYGAFWQAHVKGDSLVHDLSEVPSAQQRQHLVRRLTAEQDNAKGRSVELAGAYVDACYARLGRHLGLRARADSALTSLLVTQALAPIPQRRASAKALATKLTAMMAQQTDTERQAVRLGFTRMAWQTPLSDVG